MSETPTPRHILVFGADGSVGRQVVEQALALSHTVRAVERAWPDGLPERAGLERRTADVLNDDLSELTEGVDAVISALGLAPSPQTVIDPPPLYTQGTLAIVQAMRAHGVKRLAVISASFVVSADRGPPWFRLPAMTALHRIFGQMAEMERLLQASDDIEWTAARPGWLMEGPPSGRYEVTEDVIPPDLIRTRHADLAEFMLDCVENGTWLRQTPAIAARESPAASDPPAVLRELTGLGPSAPAPGSGTASSGPTADC